MKNTMVALIASLLVSACASVPQPLPTLAVASVPQPLPTLAFASVPHLAEAKCPSKPVTLARAGFAKLAYCRR